MNKSLKDTTALAFLGDAIFEAYVRNKLIQGKHRRADRLHRAAVKYVKAESQGYAMKNLLEELTEEELALVKRARNKRIVNKPRKIDPIQYKWATAFEALIGYLYLEGQEERMDFIMKKAMESIDE